MAGFFGLESARSTKKRDQKLAKTASRPVQSSTAVKIKGGGTLLDKIQAIISLVKSKFDGKEDELQLITTEEDLAEYINKCIENNIISIDTETTGLDPILDQLVGICIYTPGMKAAYIPVNHISYITQLKCDNQLPVETLKKYFQILVDANVRSVWFNAPFDIRFLGNHIGVWFTPYFDTSVAAMCLNSDEPKGQKSLKALHKKYCWGNRGEALTFGKLFESIPFNLVPITTAYLYAASDAIYTYELYEFQAQYLEPTGLYYESKHMQGVSNVFFNIEMKSMPTFISMEQTGVTCDFEYAEKLKERYHKLSDKMKKNLEDVFKPYLSKVEDYKRTHPSHPFSDPINFNSPQQLQVILYDILNLPVVDKKKPRGTDKNILKQLDHPFCKALLDYKAFFKVIGTFIDELPEIAKKYPDKRIHGKFNQYGARTGRISSSNPNLQQIPSQPFRLSDGTEIDSGHDIRQLFTATEGYTLMSCDYSGQEVRVTAHLSNDQKMIKAYQDGKDVYSEIAALAFNTTYEECCEFRPDGTTNPEGKKRRGESKKIVVGILYGRGISSIAEQLGKTTKEAQQIYDKVLDTFEGLANFISNSEDMAREFGYVETVWGRRRQLPDMQLPYYEFSYKEGFNPNFDPLDSESVVSTEVPENVVRDLTKKLLNCWGWKKREALKEQIRSQGISIKDNSSFIAKAQRQCVNARVQGSSADLTKLAQIELYNNKELKDLGFRMLIPVHDEIIAECPIKNAKRCAELMSYCMIHAGKDLCVPLKCDTELFKNWYGKDLEDIPEEDDFDSEES